VHQNCAPLPTSGLGHKRSLVRQTDRNMLLALATDGTSSVAAVAVTVRRMFEIQSAAVKSADFDVRRLPPTDPVGH
jgi:hypothetical protein